MQEVFKFVDSLLPILSIVIPVFATVYTVNNRIKNENKENHKPYLLLDKVRDLNQIDAYSYYLTPIGRNYLEKYPNIDYNDLKGNNDIIVKLILKNIGYGVATNIKFYNLLTAEQVYGTQESSKEQNQKLFTTFDIAANEEKSVQAKLINLLKEEEGIIIEDHIRILCVYQDLNNNIFNFIISINAKENNHYDFFTYQPSSLSYKRWIKENKKQFKSIIKKYMN
ncbi:MAG: hypothetical protein E7169_04430 [Firmicutes bacterium]|nr:hypothetical protein [Bacillota bacterium]